MRMKPRVKKTEFYLAASLRLSDSIASQNNCELMANLKHVNKVFTIPMQIAAICISHLFPLCHFISISFLYLTLKVRKKNPY